MSESLHTVAVEAACVSVHRLRPLAAVVQLLVLITLSPTPDLVAQTPPYSEEEVTFANGAVTLSGTLTVPAARQLHPAVILISGSGPQDRDESVPSVPGYLPFRWIADHLGRHGFAVLRYDDRGTAKSTGEHSVATSLDLAGDAEAALGYLVSRRNVDASRIGMLGHSEGGFESEPFLPGGRHRQRTRVRDTVHGFPSRIFTDDHGVAYGAFCRESRARNNP